MRCVLHDDDTVDEDSRASAARVPVRLSVSRLVLEIGGVEDRDIGPPALFQKPAVRRFSARAEPPVIL